MNPRTVETEDADAAMLARLKAHVCWFVANVAKGLPHQDFEDVCLIGFDEGVKGLQTFDPSKVPFQNPKRTPNRERYVRWKARMAVLDELNRFSLRHRLFTSLPERDLISEQQTPSMEAERQDNYRRSATLLSQLQEPNRSVLKQYFMDGAKQREIAERLGISQAGVSTMKDAAINWLRARFDKIAFAALATLVTLLAACSTPEPDSGIRYIPHRLHRQALEELHRQQ